MQKLARIFLALALYAGAALPAGAACWQWSLTASSNATVDPTINWAEGMAPSAVNDSARAMMARLAECRDDLSGKLTTGGTSVAYTITSNQSNSTGIAATPGDGQQIVARFHVTNGVAPTLVIDGGTAFPIQGLPGIAIPSGTLTAGSPYRLTFSAGSSAWLAQDYYSVSVNIQTLLDSIGSTRGSVLSRGASAWAAITPGTAGFIFTSLGAGADPAWAAPVAQLPRGYIDGCIMANGDGSGGGDQVNDITFTAGAARDSTNAANATCNALTKQLDANWVAGTNQGMRNSAAGIANTTYHIFVVCTAVPVCDYYAHTSPTVATVLTALQAEPGGSSYAYARQIGSIIRASAAILIFTQYGDEIIYSSPAMDVNDGASGTGAKTGTLVTIPTGIIVLAKLNIVTGATKTYISALAQADLAPSSIAAPLSSTYDGANESGVQAQVYTNTSAQFRYRNGTGAQFSATTLGYVHPRGRNQ